MTLTRRRVRVSKYIAQVNHMGTDMGTKFMLLYFIYIKQLLNASKWRTDSPLYPYPLRSSKVYFIHLKTIAYTIYCLIKAGYILQNMRHCCG